MSGGALLLTVAATGSAAAHVDVEASTTEPGAIAELSFAVPHGCDGSPTTAVAVRIPTGVLGVVAESSASWSVETETAQMVQPIVDARGREITERVMSVTYTAAEPLPDGVSGEVSMSLQLPPEAGTQLWFPVVQTCEDGEAAWIEVAAPGQEAIDLAMPAPALTVGAEPGQDGETGAGDATRSEVDDEAAADDDGGRSWVTTIAVPMLIGVAVALAVALRRRRRA